MAGKIRWLHSPSSLGLCLSYPRKFHKSLIFPSPGLCTELMFIGETLPRSQDPLLRHRSLLVLCHVWIRPRWVPYSGLLFQGRWKFLLHPEQQETKIILHFLIWNLHHRKRNQQKIITWPASSPSPPTSGKDTASCSLNSVSILTFQWFFAHSWLTLQKLPPMSLLTPC